MDVGEVIDQQWPEHEWLINKLKILKKLKHCCPRAESVLVQHPISDKLKVDYQVSKRVL